MTNNSNTKDKTMTNTKHTPKDLEKRIEQLMMDCPLVLYHAPEILEALEGLANITLFMNAPKELSRAQLAIAKAKVKP